MKLWGCSLDLWFLAWPVLHLSLSLLEMGLHSAGPGPCQ